MAVFTITSDFGSKDHHHSLLRYQAEIAFPEHKVIELCQDIEQLDEVHAGIVVRAAYKNFPKGSVHYIAVKHYPSFENKNFPAVLKFDEHYFLSCDNGVFGSIVGSRVDYELYYIDDAFSNPLVETKPFQAIFSKIAEHLFSNKTIEEFAEKKHQIRTSFNFPQKGVSEIIGTIIHVDHFGNVISNVDRNVFDNYKNKDFVIQLGFHKDEITELSVNPSHGRPGKPVAYFNDAGLLELALSYGVRDMRTDISKMYGFRKDSRFQIRFNEAPTGQLL